MAAPTFAEIAAARYLLLTTFTKDGRPKPTAIWAAPDGDRLLVMTEEDSWKVKRIRNTPRVTLAICDHARQPEEREYRSGGARYSTSPRRLAVQRAVNKRYGVLGWLFGMYMKVRGLDKKSVGLELRAV